MLFAASEAANEQGAIYTTPAEITAKYMWTPPIPNASQLVHQLAAADVYLEEDAFDFFMCLCGGHRSIFMRSMQWVHDRQMKEKKSARWDIRRSLGEARHSWGNGNWTATDTVKRSSLCGMLLESRAICVNGKYKDANNIPDEFVEILCQGASGSLNPELPMHPCRRIQPLQETFHKKKRLLFAKKKRLLFAKKKDPYLQKKKTLI